MSDSPLGKKGTDSVSGYTGVILARNESLFTVPQLLIQSQELKDFVPITALWFDEPRVKVEDFPSQNNFKRPIGLRPGSQ